MAGVTDKGFEIKRLRQVISDLQREAVNQFGSEISTDVDSVLGRGLQITAPSIADVWEAAEQTYNNFFPGRAEGDSLDALVALGGLTREQASPSISPVIVVGEKDTVLPAGSTARSSFTRELFETQTPVFFNTNNLNAVQIEPVNAVEGKEYRVSYDNSEVSYTAVQGDTVESIALELKNAFDAIPLFNAYIAAGNPKVVQVDSADPFRRFNFFFSPFVVARNVSKLINVVAQKDGPLEQPAGTINEIAAPVRGWASIINPVAASVGRFRETDEELRFRFAETKETRASNTLEAIYSDIRNIQDVEKVVVYENDTGQISPRGFPEHSIVTVVEGGNSLQIAESIWKNKPAGIQTFGNTLVTITDSQGFIQEIDFVRPVEVPVYVNLEITALQGFAADGVDQIKQAIIDYINEKYSIGDKVIYSRLYTPINSIPNHQVEDMTIGTSPDPTQKDNIPVSFDEIAESAVHYINITVN